MASIVYDCYSVDASVMIALTEMGPHDIFEPAWDEISRLVSDNRWKIFETVADELHDDELKNWLIFNDSAIVKFNEIINHYLTSLMAECQNNNMMLINPNNTRNIGDPFVVMLALYYEERDLNDLRVKTSGKRCCVLTNELSREHKINIPYVCNYYDIPYMHLFDFMRHHQWQISIDVQNP